ncbi:S-adenosyl-l-methionine hydroxide adenosyltransferase family protein [Streptomyces olivochromogenes]|uniref:SAM hydrolase/SAM-dependent halogenase family protein n=1 Tax=Streptomyces olivochromogenes TaxID=1963 RepID=UPI0036DAD2F9
MRKFISLTSDFGVQTQGVGIMEGTALSIAPDANVVHLMHGLPEFDVVAAARTMETVQYLPVGSHVCVCDPGVGTARRAIICQVGRGDYLVGPDNGVLGPAGRVLGGILAVHEITNRAYMREPVSAIFHGRDIFTPAAAHLANGVPIGDFGPPVDPDDLVTAPYQEAVGEDGRIRGKIIQINRYGSLHLNITHEQWDANGISEGDEILLELTGHEPLKLQVCRTFGDVAEGVCLILKDDYGRVEVAKNLGSFVQQYPVKIGDAVSVVFGSPDLV